MSVPCSSTSVIKEGSGWYERLFLGCGSSASVELCVGIREFAAGFGVTPHMN